MRRRHILTIIILLALVASACSGNTEDALETTSEPAAPDAEFIEGEPTAIPLVDEETSGEPEEVPQEPSEPEAVDAGEGEEPEEIEEPEPTCEAPELVGHFVDVEIDDPDGGLNMRVAPGSQAAVVDTFARGSELIALGNCEVVTDRDWWEVTTSDGSQTGWVAARFLSDLPAFNPGLGAPINDTDNVGISRPTIEELAQAIADSYGFDEDLVITEASPPDALDSIGGEVTYELTGLKDDASNGYLVDISFSFDREEDGGPITGYTTLRVTSQALCTRGVTQDGLCI